MTNLLAGPMPTDESLSQLLNVAWAEARDLPFVVPVPGELPLLTPVAVREHRAEGWLDPALTVVSGGHSPVMLVEARQVDEEVAQIGWLATHPAVRRQGLARQGVQYLLEELRTRGLKVVRTTMVDSRLSNLCAFWEAMGFTVQDPHGQNIVMKADLAACPPPPLPSLPAPYALRPLKPSDVPVWLEVKNRVFESHSEAGWFEATFSSRWDFDWDGWLVITRDDEIVGIAAADYHRDPARPETVSGAHIEYVGVLPECRGLRLGETLMMACLQHILNRGLTECTLITQPFRVPAIRLYERLGFRLQRENRIYRLDLQP
jgi:ribosomal protein S18 acetylase RimI-like enzyme